MFLVGSVFFYFCKSDVSVVSRSSKVTDFGTNRKHVCDFLLVCHSNLVISLPFQRYCRSDCAPDPTLFHLFFFGGGGCSRWTRSLMFGSARAGLSFKLFSCKIIFEFWSIFQACSLYEMATMHRQTDRRRDRRHVAKILGLSPYISVN